MGVIWNENLRARLSRIFNLKGEGPPQFLPLSDGVQLVYDIGEDVTITATDTSAIPDELVREGAAMSIVNPNLHRSKILSDAPKSPAANNIVMRIRDDDGVTPVNGDTLVFTDMSFPGRTGWGFGARGLVAGLYRWMWQGNLSFSTAATVRNIQLMLCSPPTDDPAAEVEFHMQHMTMLGSPIAMDIGQGDFSYDGSAIVNVTDNSHVIAGIVCPLGGTIDGWSTLRVCWNRISNFNPSFPFDSP